MPRIDDYINARKLARAELQNRSLDSIVLDSGYSLQDGQLLIPFLDKQYLLVWPGLEFKNLTDPADEIPLQEQVLILHYLLSSPPPGLSDDWVSYREIPGATFYYSAFAKRALDPLRNVFGQDIGAFKKAALQLQGSAVDYGDAGYEFFFFPKVPLRLILWKGDEEFPASANIVFEKGIKDILSPEDIAWMAGMQVYRMIKLSFS